jgi:hypothetical protein
MTEAPEQSRRSANGRSRAHETRFVPSWTEEFSPHAAERSCDLDDIGANISHSDVTKQTILNYPLPEQQPAESAVRENKWSPPCSAPSSASQQANELIPQELHPVPGGVLR